MSAREMAKKKFKKQLQSTNDAVAVALSGHTISNTAANAPQGRSPKTPPRDIAAEFAEYFGRENDLANWQRFCRDLGIEVQLHSVRQCKAVCIIRQ